MSDHTVHSAYNEWSHCTQRVQWVVTLCIAPTMSGHTVGLQHIQLVVPFISRLFVSVNWHHNRHPVVAGYRQVGLVTEETGNRINAKNVPMWNHSPTTIAHHTGQWAHDVVATFRNNVVCPVWYHCYFSTCKTHNYNPPFHEWEYEYENSLLCHFSGCCIRMRVRVYICGCSTMFVFMHMRPKPIVWMLRLMHFYCTFQTFNSFWPLYAQQQWQTSDPAWIRLRDFQVQYGISYHGMHMTREVYTSLYDRYDREQQTGWMTLSRYTLHVLKGSKYWGVMILLSLHDQNIIVYWYINTHVKVSKYKENNTLQKKIYIICVSIKSDRVIWS